MLAGVLFAQAPAASAIKPPANASAIPTLQSLDYAARMQDCTLVQLRRFRDDNSNLVTVRERLEIDADGSHEPKFALSFLGVEGELPGSRLNTHWSQMYGRFATQFYRHSSFRVRDLLLAQTNYTVHDFGPTIRAGRSTRRVVVFPQSLDKAVWVIDVDQATGVTLYSAEFDTQMRLLAEVEAISFAPHVQPLAATTVGSGPSTTFGSFAAANTALGDPAGLIDPDVQVVAEYRLTRAETHVDPLNGQQKLAMTYSDGIDQFTVVQLPGTTDVFAGLPGGGNSGGHTIGRFRDPAVSALLFWEGGVSFQVAGRGALHRLDELARSLYVQALSSN